MSSQYDPNRFEPTSRPVNDDARSVPELLGDMLTQFSDLIRKEVHLARAEMGEKVGEARGAIPGMAAGAGLAFGGLLLLLLALSALVSRLLNLQEGWGLLIVGVVAALIGYGLIRGAMSRLASTDLIPKRTAEQLARDAQAAKEQTQ